MLSSSQSAHGCPEARPPDWEDRPMSSALPAPTVSGLVSHWSVQPVAVVGLAALVVWYSRTVRTHRAEGNPWPRSRVITFSIGVVLTVWTTCGFPQAYGRSLFWIWTSQQLGLLLILPAVVLGGGPP